jgi:6-phosphofructokinase 2
MAQTPIVTLTLNPALDASTSVDEVKAGPKLRCGAPRFDPGGGGINVSRVIARLGGKSIACAAVGGASGAHVQALLAAEGIDLHAIQAPGATRQSLAVTEDRTGRQYRFVMPGEEWTETLVSEALVAIRQATPKGAFLVVSGSQPPGFPPDFVLTLADALKDHAAVLLDTSGEPLKKIAKTDGANLRLLRMDADEADELTSCHLVTNSETADFAAGLVAREVAQTVIIARGAEGSILASKQGRWFCKAAHVPVKSKIGAGDSFVAGYVLAIVRGEAEDIALANGVAAASAAVMTEGTELCRAEDAAALIAACPVIRI